jgi:hypothetical protein
MKKILSAFFAAAVATAIAGCTGDDTIGPTADGGGVTDGGARDGSNPLGDGGGDTGPGADGGDGGPCDFAAYVTDLVKNKTKDNTPPTTDLGSGCVDKQDQSQFKPLFP